MSGIEAVLGELIHEMLTLIESKYSKLYFDNQITIICSEFVIPFEDLSIEDAYISLISWKTFLKGSPKKPTSTANGRLEIVLNFIDCKFCSVLIS